jgi:hypothetical protein
MCNTDKITSWFVTVWYEHWLNALDGSLDIDGEAFQVLDEDGLRELGEDPESATVPLIIRRDSDGQCFEVEFDAVAWETDRGQRDADRAMHEHMRQIRERYVARAAAARDAARAES